MKLRAGVVPPADSPRAGFNDSLESVEFGPASLVFVPRWETAFLHPAPFCQITS